MKARTIQIIDLLRDIDAARGRMSVNNPHRNLLHRCGAAIIELGQRAEGMEVQYLGTPEQAEAVEGVPV